ncbi:ABC transporter substrate-binding protein [Hamadaea sp. NPDC050747]|uniref:ABC transporter substrate-binding protein n=1 Tax=Hamadaea sp. NPDC050747 TaxID=3155789 RepID=UPI0033C72A3F
MTKVSRRAALGGGLALVAAPFLWAGHPAAAARPRTESGMQGPVRLGVLTHQTGPLAAYAQRQLLGVRTRADQVNAAGGHGSAPEIELLVREAGADEKSAATAASALLDEGVHAVIAATAPWLTEAAAGQCTLGCVPVIAPVTGIVPTGPYAFQSAPSAAQVLRTALGAAKKAGASKLGHLATDKLASPPIVDLVQTEAANQGLSIAGFEPVPVDATDLKDAVGKLVAAKPDVLVISALPPQSGAAVRDARAGGWTGPIVLTPEGVHPSFHSTAGDAADGVQAVSPWLPVADSAPDSVPNLATVRRFAEAFAPNGPANPAAGFGADAVALTHQAFLGHRDRKMAREQLENACCVGVCGVYNLTAADHGGLADDALTVLTSKSGKWSV